MANDDRLVELMAEMLIKQDEMVTELRNVKTEVSGVIVEVKSMNTEITKLNLLSAENTRAIIKLANKLEDISDLDNRLKKLESAVFK